MKLTLTCLALALALTGCGGGGGDGTPPAAGTTQATTNPFGTADDDPIPGPQAPATPQAPAAPQAPAPQAPAPQAPAPQAPAPQAPAPQAPASNAPYSNGADADNLDNVWACHLNQLDMTSFYLILLDDQTGGIILPATDTTDTIAGVIEWSENAAGDLEYVDPQTSETVTHINNRFEGNDTMLADSLALDGEPAVDSNGDVISIQCFREAIPAE